MNYRHIFRVFFFLAVFLSVAGCQSTSVRQSGTTQITIEDNGLSRISDKTQVIIQIKSGESILETLKFNGLAPLPYTFTPSLVSENSSLTALVSVTFADEVILRAEKVLILKQMNSISFQRTDSDAKDESYWAAVDVAGRGIPPDVSTTIALRGQGKITGFAGCNQYRGFYRTVSSLIVFDEIESTSNICANPVMYHENRYFKFLKSVEIFHLDNDQLMLYTSESDKPIVFTRIDKQEILLSLGKTNSK